MLLPVPPKSAMTPRRKQNFYEFSNILYAYASDLNDFKQSADFDLEDVSVKDAVNEELLLLERLNEFQVAQISEY